MEESIAANLTVQAVAEIAGCHPQTVKSYEKKGLIRSFRDINGWRRFTESEALKMKRLWEIRER
jgi:DNA-binding transcriptional MerR regulator